MQGSLNCKRIKLNYSWNYAVLLWYLCETYANSIVTNFYCKFLTETQFYLCQQCRFLSWEFQATAISTVLVCIFTLCTLYCMTPACTLWTLGGGVVNWTHTHTHTHTHPTVGYLPAHCLLASDCLTAWLPHTTSSRVQSHPTVVWCALFLTFCQASVQFCVPTTADWKLTPGVSLSDEEQSICEHTELLVKSCDWSFVKARQLNENKVVLPSPSWCLSTIVILIFLNLQLIFIKLTKLVF